VFLLRTDSRYRVLCSFFSIERRFGALLLSRNFHVPSSILRCLIRDDSIPFFVLTFRSFGTKSAARSRVFVMASGARFEVRQGASPNLCLCMPHISAGPSDSLEVFSISRKGFVLFCIGLLVYLARGPNWLFVLFAREGGSSDAVFLFLTLPPLPFASFPPHGLAWLRPSPFGYANSFHRGYLSIFSVGSTRFWPPDSTRVRRFLSRLSSRASAPTLTGTYFSCRISPFSPTTRTYLSICPKRTRDSASPSPSAVTHRLLRRCMRIVCQGTTIAAF